MARPTPPSVAVVVLNWNGGADSVECLESLFHMKYPAFRVYLVDNGSTDDSLEIVRAYASGARFVRSPYFEFNPGNKPVAYAEVSLESEKGAGVEIAQQIAASGQPSLIILRSSSNLGFARGNNAGIQFAQLVERPAYVFILNNDAVADPEVLTELVRVGESDPTIGVIGATIFFYDRAERHDRIQFAGGSVDLDRFPGYFPLGNSGPSGSSDGDCVECQWVSGTAMLVKAHSVPVCTFDESFFFGCEDVDLCLQLQSRGFRVVLSHRGRVWHKGGVSRAKRYAGRHIRIWLEDVRTDIRFLSRHHPQGRLRIPLYVCQALVGRLRYDADPGGVAGGVH